MLLLSLLETDQVGTEGRCTSGLGLEVGNSLGRRKSERGNWDGIHDVLPDSNLECGVRSGCVEKSDMVSEGPVCCSAFREVLTET